MRHPKSGLTPSIACLAVVSALLGACDPADDRVIPPETEKYSRNDSAAVAVAVADAARPSAEARVPALPVLPSRESISDGVITTRIKTALLSDDGLAGSDISVTTDHGVVILNGTVKSYEQTGIASSYAQRQDGVMRVDNQLALLPG